MKIFVESIDRGIWDAIENDPFIPKFEKDDAFIQKPRDRKQKSSI